MMEYVCFGFTPFGDDTRVSSLGDLLLHSNAKYSCEGFEKVVAFAGYPHVTGVAHNDLKPASILVSNQHYCFSNDIEITRQISLHMLCVNTQTLERVAQGVCKRTLFWLRKLDGVIG